MKAIAFAALAVLGLVRWNRQPRLAGSRCHLLLRHEAVPAMGTVAEAATDATRMVQRGEAGAHCRPFFVSAASLSPQPQPRHARGFLFVRAAVTPP